MSQSRGSIRHVEAAGWSGVVEIMLFMVDTPSNEMLFSTVFWSNVSPSVESLVEGWGRGGPVK
jgi:hypothetical protein